MRVAIVGGTGSFGRGLAARLRDLGHDVAIGSRDEARARERAAAIGVAGGTNEEIVRDAGLVVLAVQSSAAIDTARELADTIGETPLLCVASDLRFGEDGVFPGRNAGSIAEDVAARVRGPVVSGLQALPAAHLAHPDPPDQDLLLCGDDAQTNPCRVSAITSGGRERTIRAASRRITSRRRGSSSPASSRAASEGSTLSSRITRPSAFDTTFCATTTTSASSNAVARARSAARSSPSRTSGIPSTGITRSSVTRCR